MIYNYAIGCKKDPATVGKIVNGKYTTDYNKWCTASFVDYSSFINQIDLIKNKCISVIESHYKVKCLETEIHFLYYSTGTEYKTHIDGQYIENNIAKRGVDRDLTCVVYLNSDYLGGEINFNFFDLTIKPNVGDMLIYPSSYEYAHSVKPVTGERYAIVFWFKTSPNLNVDTVINDKSVIKYLMSITS